MSDPAITEPAERQELFGRRLRVRYILLTVGIFLPLIWAFVAVRNVYPLTAWTVMMGGGDLQRSHRYFLLRGETVTGEVVNIPAIKLTDALSGRTWGMVVATVDNRAFQLRSLHPENAALLATAGDIVRLPRAARLPELLRAWGEIYNSRLPPSSPQRLKAIRLDTYRWLGQRYSDYDSFIETWRQEL
ncbi:MAG: hypothetical protein ND895_01355 [Pyrinomonadaceae bacterium]|nr:hypothetical protein [Pyrinomonadaceae bacterium]